VERTLLSVALDVDFDPDPDLDLDVRSGFTAPGTTMEERRLARRKAREGHDFQHRIAEEIRIFPIVKPPRHFVRLKGENALTIPSPTFVCDIQPIPKRGKLCQATIFIPFPLNLFRQAIHRQPQPLSVKIDLSWLAVSNTLPPAPKTISSAPLTPYSSIF
jgi:hypothetical protein